MRAIMLAVLFVFPCGVLTMNATATKADDKKDEKFNEVMSLRIWDAKSKQFIKAMDVKAHRRVVEGDRLIFVLDSIKKVVKDSEVTDKDGVTFLVTKVQGGASGFYTCDVTKKEIEKKP